MSDSDIRELMEAFSVAYASCEPGRIEPFLHDDVVWTIGGPVDIIRFCGTYRGKTAVIDLATRVLPSLFRNVSLIRESIVVDGDRVAVLNRMSAHRNADDRTISYRLAQFIRIRDNKIIEYRSLLDSFDAAEQMLGHPLDVGAEHADDLPVVRDGSSLIAV
jgi:ketosteroid isomerase-like protein